MISAPNRSACARISAIRSGPMIPSRYPGQFSTIVVSINWPPASSPSMTSGFRFARAVYSAAVNPAGPDPITMTFRTTAPRSSRVSRLSPPTSLCDVLVDDFLQRILVGETDDLLDDLAALEQEQRRDA